MDQPAMAELEASGFVLARGIVDTDRRERLLTLCDPERSPSAVRHRSGTAYAARGLLWSVQGLTPEMASCGLDALAAAALGREAVAVDAIFFDKQITANWTVPGHQDRVMPVADARPAALRMPAMPPSLLPPEPVDPGTRAAAPTSAHAPAPPQPPVRAPPWSPPRGPLADGAARPATKMPGQARDTQQAAG